MHLNTQNYQRLCIRSQTRNTVCMWKVEYQEVVYVREFHFKMQGFLLNVTANYSLVPMIPKGEGAAFKSFVWREGRERENPSPTFLEWGNNVASDEENMSKKRSKRGIPMDVYLGYHVVNCRPGNIIALIRYWWGLYIQLYVVSRSPPLVIFRPIIHHGGIFPLLYL